MQRQSRLFFACLLVANIVILGTLAIRLTPSPTPLETLPTEVAFPATTSIQPSNTQTTSQTAELPTANNEVASSSAVANTDVAGTLPDATTADIINEETDTANAPIASTTSTNAAAVQPMGVTTIAQQPAAPSAEIAAQIVPNQHLITFAPSATDVDRAAYLAQINGVIVDEIRIGTSVTLVVNSTLAQLPVSPMIAAAEPDYYISVAQDTVYNAPTILDPLYPEQWALKYINAPEAWAKLPANAPKVTVCVIDSGVSAIAELKGRMLPGYDFVEKDADASDIFGHGTAVASIIAANVDGVGMVGIAPNAMILPLRVLDASGRGTYSDVAAALAYCADNGGQIANLSLGGYAESEMLKNAIDYAIAKGVTVVAAAGNHGGATALFPARYEPVIAVGSIGESGALSSFSSRQYDVLAPGENILVADLNGGYVSKSGTSFASAMVAGQFIIGDISFSEIAQSNDTIVSNELGIFEDELVSAAALLPTGKLNVPFFSQGDSQWGSNIMRSTCTMASHGCLVTSVAMVLEYYGASDNDPKILNEWLIANDGYANLCNFKQTKTITYALQKGVKITEFQENQAPNVKYIDIARNINEGYPVILGIDYIKSNGKPSGHWVVITDYDRLGNGEYNFYYHDPADTNSQTGKNKILRIRQNTGIKIHIAGQGYRGVSRIYTKTYIAKPPISPTPVYTTEVPFWNLKSNEKTVGWIPYRTEFNQYQSNGISLNLPNGISEYESPIFVLDANTHPFVMLEMATTNNTCEWSLLYKPKGVADYSDNNREVKFILPADGETHAILLDMRIPHGEDNVSRWNFNGAISQIKIRTNCTQEFGKVRFNYVSFPVQRTNFTFANTRNGIIYTEELEFDAVKDGGVVYENSQDDGQIWLDTLVGPDGKSGIDIGAYPLLKIAFSSSTPNQCLQVFFRLDGDDNFTEDNSIEHQHNTSGGEQTAVIDFRQVVSSGRIVQIRIDPTCTNVSGGFFRINSVAFASPAAPLSNSQKIVNTINTANANSQPVAINLDNNNISITNPIVAAASMETGYTPICGFPIITGDVTIVGDATLIERDSTEQFSLFCVDPGGKLTLENMILRNGSSPFGGGIYNNGGEVNLKNVHFEDNFADNTGGAIYSNGTLTVTDSIFTNNSANDDGSAVYNSGNTSISNSCLVGNSVNSVAHAGGTTYAANNWWGIAAGPGGAGGGYGDSINAGVSFAPFLTTAPANCPTLPNQAPIIASPSNQTHEAGTTINLAISAVDPEGLPLRFSADKLPHGLTLDTATGIISGVLTPDIAFNDIVLITVIDAEGEQDAIDFIWTITLPNRCPSPDPKAHLSAVIEPSSSTSEWITRITNTSDCLYDVGFAAYQKVDNIIANQFVYAPNGIATALQIGSGETVLMVQVPQCATQLDVFFDASHLGVYLPLNQSELDTVPLVLPAFNTGFYGQFGNWYSSANLQKNRLLKYRHIYGTYCSFPSPDSGALSVNAAPQQPVAETTPEAEVTPESTVPLEMTTAPVIEVTPEATLAPATDATLAPATEAPPIAATEIPTEQSPTEPPAETTAESN